ncbi:unnamed protein product [Dracunculus medinensis]|uniref:E3 ubiquitin-protein ligase RNF170 n=1 Tax=Dracunculus medinensis TaxID=318479 RepID=A0A3P7SX23_DRAME|nr:unnamed protein product [Dracunculus medinensis]
MQENEAIEQGEAPRTYGSDRTCPICFLSASFAITTNCGHLFCCKCICGYWRYFFPLNPVQCPVCRTPVTLLIPCPIEGEVESNSEEAGLNDNMLVEYNRRFSGERRPFMDHIRDLPVIIPHLLRTLLSFRGLVLMSQCRIILCLLGLFFYVIIPGDLLPENVFGIFGFLDDILIVFFIFVYISIMFRQLLGAGNLHFGWNINGEHNQ